MKKTFLQKAVPVVVVALLCATTNLGFVSIAQATAGSLNTLSDTVTNHNTSGLTSNDIFFKLGPNGLAASGGSVGFNYAGTAVVPTIATASISATNFKLFTGGTVGTPGSGAAQTFNTITSGAATATSTLWGLASTSSSLTLTPPTGMTTLASNTVIELQIGTVAGGTNIITNSASTGTTVLTITVTTTGGPDTSSVAMPIVTNDQVLVTATVYPTITFNITAGGSGVGGSATNTVDFGVLNSAAPQFAKSGAGSGGFTTTATPALDLSIGTNAGSGYALTYTAPTTLTTGTASIAAATITGSNTGTPNTAQFAMSAIQTAGSGATIPSAYQFSATPGSSNWSFATPAVTTLASHGSPVSDTVSVRYLANIPSGQAPGAYSLTMTYIATANF